MTSSADDLTFEDNVRLLIQYQAMMMQHLEGALKNDYIDEHTYTRFKNKGGITQAREEILNHFDQIFRELVGYYQERLRERILKGADFIDSLPPSDPRRDPAMKKYDRLIEQLKESEDRANVHYSERSS